MDEVPTGYKAVVPDEEDPYPIEIFGEGVIPDNRLSEFLTKNIYFYIRFYNRIVSHGLPYDNWTDAPSWVLDLYDMFKTVEVEYENYRRK